MFLEQGLDERCGGLVGGRVPPAGDVQDQLLRRAEVDGLVGASQAEISPAGPRELDHVDEWQLQRILPGVQDLQREDFT